MASLPSPSPSLSKLLSENVVIIFHGGKSYRLLSETTINSWTIRICSPTVPKDKITENILVCIETIEYGDNVFWMERDKEKTIEENIAAIEKNITNYQLSQAEEQYSSWKAWRRSEKKNIYLS